MHDDTHQFNEIDLIPVDHVVISQSEVVKGLACQTKQSKLGNSIGQV